MFLEYNRYKFYYASLRRNAFRLGLVKENPGFLRVFFPFPARPGEVPAAAVLFPGNMIQYRKCRIPAKVGGEIRRYKMIISQITGVGHENKPHFFCFLIILKFGKIFVPNTIIAGEY